MGDWTTWKIEFSLIGIYEESLKNTKCIYRTLKRADQLLDRVNTISGSFVKYSYLFPLIEIID